MTKSQADYFVVNYGGATAIAGINCSINLDPESKRRQTVTGELDPRDYSLGNGETGPASWISIDHHRVLGVRQRLLKRQWGMRIEKFLVFQFENGEIHAWRDGLHDRGQLVPRLIRLDLHFAGVLDNMRIGQNPFAADHSPAGGDVSRLFFCPRLARIRLAKGSEDFYHRVLDRFRRSRGW